MYCTFDEIEQNRQCFGHDQVHIKRTIILANDIGNCINENVIQLPCTWSLELDTTSFKAIKLFGYPKQYPKSHFRNIDFRYPKHLAFLTYKHIAWQVFISER